MKTFDYNKFVIQVANSKDGLKYAPESFTYSKDSAIKFALNDLSAMQNGSFARIKVHYSNGLIDCLKGYERINGRNYPRNNQ